MIVNYYCDISMNLYIYIYIYILYIYIYTPARRLERLIEDPRNETSFGDVRLRQ